MLAARWDSAADLGSAWRRTFRRHTTGRNPVDLAMVPPVAIRVWGRDGAVDAQNRPLPPRLEASGLVSADHFTATVMLTSSEVNALGVGRWETAIVVGDAATGEPVVLSRGYLHVTGSVNDW